MAEDNKLFRSAFVFLGVIALIAGGAVLSGRNEQKAEDDTASNPNSAGEDKVAIEDTVQTELAVSANKCRGCGKCVRIDPEHFALDAENRTALVISMDNLDSEELKLAADNCEDGAIIIS